MPSVRMPSSVPFAAKRGTRACQCRGLNLAQPGALTPPPGGVAASTPAGDSGRDRRAPFRAAQSIKALSAGLSPKEKSPGRRAARAVRTSACVKVADAPATAETRGALARLPSRWAHHDRRLGWPAAPALARDPGDPQAGRLEAPCPGPGNVNEGATSAANRTRRAARGACAASHALVLISSVSARS